MNTISHKQYIKKYKLLVINVNNVCLIVEFIERKSILHLIMIS